MAELHQLQFFVLRYVPNVERGVFVPIGVVAFENGMEGSGFADLRLIDDFTHVPLPDPEFDVEVLTEFETVMRARLLSAVEDCLKGGVALPQREWMLRTILDSFSSNLQISELKGIAVPDMAKAMDDLMERYCLPRRVEPEATAAQTRKLTGRTYIRARMTHAFRNAGLIEYMRPNLSVSEFTGPGDRLKIDYYCEIDPVPGGLVASDGTNKIAQMFHAVSLKLETVKVKELAFTWPKLRDGLERQKNVMGQLTAVVEDDVDRNRKQVEFAMSTMQENGIVVRHLSQLPDVVDELRRELRL